MAKSFNGVADFFRADFQPMRVQTNWIKKLVDGPQGLFPPKPEFSNSETLKQHADSPVSGGFDTRIAAPSPLAAAANFLAQDVSSQRAPADQVMDDYISNRKI